MDGRTYHLLAAQKNIENILFTYPEEGICNLGGYFFIYSEEEKEIVMQILSMMPVAHGALRLRYCGRGILQAAEPVPVKVPVYECGEKGEMNRERRMREWMEAPFPDHTPLCRFALFHFADGVWCACEAFHHLIVDKVSFLLLTRWHVVSMDEIKRVGVERWRQQIVPDERYLALLEQGEERAVTDEQAEKWLDCYFQDDSRGWLEHPVSLSARADRKEIRIPTALQERIHAFCKNARVSAESLWYLVFFGELCLRKGISHAVIGRMVSYRQRKYHNLVGLFSRVIPVSYTWQEGETAEQCAALAKQFLVGMRYGGYSLEDLHRLNPHAGTVFDILVSYHPENMILEDSDRYRDFSNRFIDTPLRIWIHDDAETPMLEISYQTACYDGAQVEAQAARYLSMMEQVCDGRHMGEISLLTERDLAAYRSVNESMCVNPEKTLPQMFLRRCIQRMEGGEGSCILCDDTHMWDQEQALVWFYQAVDWLRKQGVGHQELVGVRVERSVMLPLILLAILHCRAAFLPVSVEESETRAESMLRDCALIIRDAELEAISGMRLPEEVSGAPRLEEVRRRAKEDQEEPIDTEILRQERAYLLYTSGSTGEPKAVQISSYSLMCRLEWMYRQYGCSGVTLQKTPYIFDVSVWELLLAPAYGGGLYLMRQGEERLPDRIGAILREQKITRVHFVPSMLELFLHYWEQEGLTGTELSLQEIFVSGEKLGTGLAEQVYRDLPQVKLVNLYGPTECTIDVSYYDCPKPSGGCEEGKEIPIGRAVANTELYILAPKSVAPGSCTVLPVGVQGELCITGDLVGLGYAGGGQGGYFSCDGRRAYRTGDRAYLGADGQIYFCGRQDQQTKLRGMRIDTGVVERLLLQRDEIRAAYAVVQGHQLVAYYEADREIMGLPELLEAELPAYNIPGVWYQVTAFPHQTNGKLDRQRLQAMVKECKTSQSVRTGEGPDTPTGKMLAEVFRKYVPHEILHPDQNLLEAGLDSLTAMQIVGEIRSQGYDCSYALIYRYPTIAMLEQELEHGDAEGQGFDYMIRKKAGHLFVCVPFGGGGSESYGGLAREVEKLPWDMAVIRMGEFGDRPVEQIADALVPQWSGYDGYTILGNCVGSALAAALAECLQRSGQTVHRVYLMASLPGRYIHLGRHRFSVWDFMSDHAIHSFLARLQSGRGEPIDFRERIPMFRRDTGRFFDYMEQRPATRCQSPVTLIFGEKDPLTIGWRRKYRQWSRYFAGTVHVTGIKGAGHYLLPEYEKGIASFLLRDWQDDTFDTGGME